MTVGAGFHSAPPSRGCPHMVAVGTCDAYRRARGGAPTRRPRSAGATATITRGDRARPSTVRERYADSCDLRARYRVVTALPTPGTTLEQGPDVRSRTARHLLHSA